MKFFCLIICIAVFTFSASAEDSFLRLRSDQIKMQQEICLAHLAADGIEAETATLPVSQNKNCTVDTPVILKSVVRRGANAMSVSFSDKPVLSCAFASNFAGFIMRLADPYAEATLGSNIVSVHTGPGFECRTRNHDAAAKLSAHANGLAADVSSIKLDDGRALIVGRQKPGAEKVFLKNLGKAACGFFSTVLGPGGDVQHKDHLHFDAEPRKARGGGHFCQP